MTALVVPGTVHQPSTTGALAAAIGAVAPTVARVETATDVGRLPLFSPRAEVSPAVAEWQTRVAAAAAVVICTPEYAYGPPGAGRRPDRRRLAPLRPGGRGWVGPARPARPSSALVLAALGRAGGR